MNQHAKLKAYLIKIFLISLISVGIAEIFVNILYISFLSPLLNKVFFLDRLMDKQNLSDLLFISAEGFFWWIVMNISSAFPNIIAEPIRIYAKNKSDQSIYMRILREQQHFSSIETKTYFISLVCIILLLICIWLLPFIVAAINFSILIDKKVSELEEESVEEQKRYEKQRYLLLSDMAHDLKTPITTISGYAEAMVRGDVPEESKHIYLEAIHQKSLQMNHVITLLFEYVRLDSAGFSIHPTTENYSELVRGCVAALYSDFEEKQMNIEMFLPNNDIYAYVDKAHFERAINNILINAYKHNPCGTTVTILLKLHHEKIILRIYDDGVRIAEDTISHIFEPFVQGDASRTSKSGTGLGLSISKKVIEMHKGTLEIFQPQDSSNAKYTKVFELTIPNPSYDYN